MSTKGATSAAATVDGSTKATITSDDIVQGVKRTKEQILAGLVADGSDPFTPIHTSLGPSFLAVAGPVDDSAHAKAICNEWSFNKASQPLGTFTMRINGARTPVKKRGRRFKMECRRGCGYGWWYEKAADRKYHLQKVVSLTHGPDCLKKDAAPAGQAAVDKNDFHARAAPLSQRLTAAMQLVSKLKEIGSRSPEACDDVVSAMEQLVEELDAKHPYRDEGRPRATGDGVEGNGAGVHDPANAKTGRGRTDGKRKRGATSNRTTS